MSPLAGLQGPAVPPAVDSQDDVLREVTPDSKNQRLLCARNSLAQCGGSLSDTLEVVRH